MKNIIKKENTQTKAKNAALQLLIKGEQPTAHKIRSELGDKGGMPQIQEGLRDFWAELGKTLESYQSRPGMPDIAFEAMNSLWDHLLEAADQKHAISKGELSLRIVELQEALDKEKEGVKERENECQTISDNLEILHKESEVIKEQLTASQNDFKFISEEKDRKIQSLNSDNLAIDLKNKELNFLLKSRSEETKNQVRLLESIVRDLRSQIEKSELKYDSNLKELTVKISEMTEINHSLFSENTKLKARIEIDTTIIQTLTSKSDSLEKSLAKISDDFSVLKSDDLSKDKRLIKLESELENSKNIIEKLTKDLDSASLVLTENQTEISNLLHRLSVYNQKG